MQTGGGDGAKSPARATLLGVRESGAAEELQNTRDDVAPGARVPRAAAAVDGVPAARRQARRAAVRRARPRALRHPRPRRHRLRPPVHPLDDQGRTAPAAARDDRAAPRRRRLRAGRAVQPARAAARRRRAPLRPGRDAADRRRAARGRRASSDDRRVPAVAAAAAAVRSDRGR